MLSFGSLLFFMCILLLDVWFELYLYGFGFPFRSKLGCDESAVGCQSS